VGGGSLTLHRPELPPRGRGSCDKSRMGAGVRYTVASGDLSKTVFHRIEQVGKKPESKQ